MKHSVLILSASLLAGIAIARPLSDMTVKPVCSYDFEYTIEDTTGDNNGEMCGQETFTDGKTRKALLLSGNMQFVEIANPVSDSFTLAMWVKTTSTGGSEHWYNGAGLIDGEVSGPANDFGTAVLDGKFAFGVGQPDTTISSTTNINDNKWHYCVATRDGKTGEIAVYVDGKKENKTIAPLGDKSEPKTLAIGKVQTGSYHLNGLIDNVKIYDTCLDSETIKSYFNK